MVTKPKQQVDRFEPIKSLIRLFYFTRYSFLFGTLLIVLAFLPVLFDFPAVRSVFIIDQPLRVLTMTLISILAAAYVVQAFRVTICNAKGRFGDEGVYRFWERPPNWLWKLRSVSVWLIGLPLPFSCVLVTINSYSDNDNVLTLALLYFLFMFLGIFCAILLLSVLDVVNRWILTPNLHDPRLFVLDHRVLLGRRESPRQWKKNRDSEQAKANPLKPRRLQSWGNTIEWMKKLRFTHGYIHSLEVWVKSDDEEEPELRKLETLLPGHVMMTVMNLSLVVAYGVSYVFVRVLGMLPDEDGLFGTLFYLVGLIMIMIGGLPSLAFYFDRYRISPLLFVGVLLGFVSVVWPGTSPHHFETAPLPTYATSPKTVPSNDKTETVVGHATTFLGTPIDVSDVVEGWAKRQQEIAKRIGKPSQDANRTFVVVTATGGGIQASGWTSRVLTGLPESQMEMYPAEVKLSHQLTGAVGLISCVSGGSVGTLQYLAKYPELIQCKNDDSQAVLQHMHTMAMRSSLEAVGWGLFFPDVLRIIGINRSTTNDRGLVQEQLWAKRMGIPTDRPWQSVNTASLNGSSGDHGPIRGDWRLGHLAYRVKAGTLPAVIFNSYIVNTGQRVMIAPFAFRKMREPGRNDETTRSTFEALEYANVLGMQTRLATAVRLSATFPYVSPTAVSDREITSSERQKNDLSRSEIVLREGHFADGGFTDNEGLLSALQFIKRLQSQYSDQPSSNRPFDRILLVRIVPFPSVKRATDISLGRSIDLTRDPTWKQALIGPALAMFNGRSVAQQERGEMDVKNLRDRETSGTSAPILFDYVNVGFRYPEDQKTKSPPLSWKLSRAEKKDIDDSWGQWCDATAEDGQQDETNLQQVYRLLNAK